MSRLCCGELDDEPTPGRHHNRPLGGGPVSRPRAPYLVLDEAGGVTERFTLFDLAELGDPDGCSPYGCRSGDAA